ncbi:hypothetical protein YC2023_084603 [Brassica napus]
MRIRSTSLRSKFVSEFSLVVSYKLHIAVPFLHFPAMNDWVTTVVRRLLYFWEARDVKKVIELMEIDIVLVDEEELLLHCEDSLLNKIYSTSLQMLNKLYENICEQVKKAHKQNSHISPDSHIVTCRTTTLMPPTYLQSSLITFLPGNKRPVRPILKTELYNKFIRLQI